MTSRALALAAVAIAVATGCTDPNAIELASWQLTSEGRTTAVTLPAHLPLPDRAHTYTLRTSVALPDAMRGERVQLVVTDLHALVELTANSAPIHRSTPYGTRYRTRGPLEWMIPASLTGGGALELELHVEHRWTQSGWLDVAPKLLPADTASGTATAVTIFNLYVAFAALIGLTQLGVTGLAIYMVDRRRHVYLWLAVQNFAAAYFPAFVVGLTQPLFGIYDAPLLAISLIVAITASVWFTHALFELPAPSRRWLALAGVGFAIAGVFHDPFVATGITGPATAVILGLMMVYQLAVSARLAVRHTDRWMARFVFGSWLFLVVSMPSDVARWLGLGTWFWGASLPSLGLLLFSAGLSLQISRRHILTLEREADQRQVANDRLAALHLLNQELRRQVADRSTHLLSRLARASDAQQEDTELGTGDRIQMRYEIIRELGRGGMGIVYEVARLPDRQHFAMKVTREISGVGVARLAREALIASRVDHPNVVSVVDVDVSASGVLYVVMELVEGKSLRAFSDRVGDTAWGFSVLGQLASGLAALHAAGIVHRDVKPANLLIMVAPDGTPRLKIADFGVSRPLPGHGPEVAEALDESSDPQERFATERDETASQTLRIGPTRKHVFNAAVTRTGILVGTPAYIAPEVFRDLGTLATTADVFAFGVITWEVLAGRQPFDRPLMQSILDDSELPPMPSLATAWTGPAEIIDAIDRCLSFEPARRPTAAELSELFERAGADRPRA